MKLRLGSPHLGAFLHRHSHAGHRPRSYEGLLRAVQLVLMVVVALFCAKLIAGGAVLLMRALSGFLT